jgi:hypothetical protein
MEFAAEALGSEEFGGKSLLPFPLSIAKSRRESDVEIIVYEIRPQFPVEITNMLDGGSASIGDRAMMVTIQAEINSVLGPGTVAYATATRSMGK